LHITTRKELLDAGRKHGRAAGPLDCWRRTAKAAQWKSLDDIRKTYSGADGVPVGDRVYTVFNIMGNAFRLVTEIYYDEQTILLRHVLTHAEYDNGNWKK
jgi:mRNA interferase HigB